MRALAVVVVLLATGCYSRRYFYVPRTEEALACFSDCINEQVRCGDGHPVANSRTTCQRYADTCVAGCRGGYEISYADWLGPDAGI